MEKKIIEAKNKYKIKNAMDPIKGVNPDASRKKKIQFFKSAIISKLKSH